MKYIAKIELIKPEGNRIMTQKVVHESYDEYEVEEYMEKLLTDLGVKFDSVEVSRDLSEINKRYVDEFYKTLGNILKPIN